MPPFNRSPRWRQLTLLAVLVAAAHVLVLRASPSSLGSKFDSDTNTVRAFATRRIEAPPAPLAAAPAPVATPRKPVPRAAPAAEEKSPAPPAKVADAAIDSIAPSSLPLALPAPPALPESTEAIASTANTTPTSELSSGPKQAANSVTTDAVTTFIAGSALPVGPKTTPVTAITLPPSVLLKYKMTGTSKGLNYQANAELSWINSGTQYDAYLKVSALFIGSRIMTSVGRVTPNGLAPTRFADKFKSELAAHFIADQGKITFSANTPDAPWIEGAQDRVSVFLQLGGILAARPKDFPAGSEITLYTIGPREADTWTFIVESEELLQMPGGDMSAIKLTRKPRREFDQKVELWYAPSIGYLPVRNRITQQNGDFIDQKLNSIGRP